MAACDCENIVFCVVLHMKVVSVSYELVWHTLSADSDLFFTMSLMLLKSMIDFIQLTFCHRIEARQMKRSRSAAQYGISQP